MNQLLYTYFENQGAMADVPQLHTTGKRVIPGCEQRPDHSRGPGVLFGDREYFTYQLDPMGALILGEDSVYGQKLNPDKLLPETEAPSILGFLTYQNVKG